MTLSSLSIYMVFTDPHQGNSVAIPKAYSGVRRKGENMKEHICNTYIVKSNLGSKKRVKSYNQIKMCMCMKYGGYIYMVANLILLYSMKTYLPFKTWKTTLPENMGYLIHLFFLFKRASEYPVF
jgi:hypothetical protein